MLNWQHNPTDYTAHNVHTLADFTALQKPAWGFKIFQAKTLENTGDSTKRQPSSRNHTFNKHQPQDHLTEQLNNGEIDGAFSNSNIVALDRGGFSGTNNSNTNTESLISGNVSVNGCNISEAVKLMTDRKSSCLS